MLSKSASHFFRQQAAAHKSAVALTAQPQRFFAGGKAKKKPNMPATNTDFDVVFVGGMNSAALVKFL